MQRDSFYTNKLLSRFTVNTSAVITIEFSYLSRTDSYVLCQYVSNIKSMTFMPCEYPIMLSNTVIIHLHILIHESVVNLRFSFARGHRMFQMVIFFTIYDFQNRPSAVILYNIHFADAFLQSHLQLSRQVAFKVLPKG